MEHIRDSENLVIHLELNGCNFYGADIRPIIEGKVKAVCVIFSIF